MNDTEVPEVGDIVIHYIDRSDQITCYGTIIEMKKMDCFVLWCFESSPPGTGWHSVHHLKVVSSMKNKNVCLET